jgi:hypothetical protein
VSGIRSRAIAPVMTEIMTTSDQGGDRDHAITVITAAGS